MQSTSPSRRQFLGTAAGGAVALSAASASRVLGANDRIRIGVIGCGGMGTGHLGGLVKRAEADNIQVVAVCDVYQRRLDAGQEDQRGRRLPRLPQGARPQGHRRRPHRHAGPLARQDRHRRDGGGQARLLREADDPHRRAGHRRARRGPQGARRSCRSARTRPPTTATGRPHEAIKAGRIGKVTWAQGSYNRNARDLPVQRAPEDRPDRRPGQGRRGLHRLGHVARAQVGPGAEDRLEPGALLPLPQVLAVQRRRRHRPALPQAGAAAHRHRRARTARTRRASTPAAGCTSRRTAATSPTCS